MKTDRAKVEVKVKVYERDENGLIAMERDVVYGSEASLEEDDNVKQVQDQLYLANLKNIRNAIDNY